MLAVDHDDDVKRSTPLDDEQELLRRVGREVVLLHDHGPTEELLELCQRAVQDAS